MVLGKPRTTQSGENMLLNWALWIENRILEHREYPDLTMGEPLTAGQMVKQAYDHFVMDSESHSLFDDTDCWFCFLESEVKSLTGHINRPDKN